MRLNSTVRFVSDGTVQRVDLTYDVQEGDVIQVFFGDVEITGGWTLQLNTTPQRVDFAEVIPADTLVLIRRYTDMREIPHVFHYTGNVRGGAEFNGKNLDDNFDKILRAAQDAMDSFELIGINLEAAQDAKESALAAAASALESKNSATQARNFATAASSSADFAAESIQTVEDARDVAESARDEAITNRELTGQYVNQADSHKQAAQIAAQDAGASATSAANSATAAQTSKDAASNSASAAATAEQGALTSAEDALGYSEASQDSAEDSAGYAEAARLSALDSASSDADALLAAYRAQKWATNPEGVVVEDGKYSAYHWAQKAYDVVMGDSTVITQDSATVGFTGVGSVLEPLIATVLSVDWSKVNGKPTAFPTTWATVTGKPTTFAPIIGTTATTAKAGNYQPTWAQVTSKPTHFATTWELVEGKPDNFITDWSDITNKPTTYPPTIGTTATTAKAGNYQPTWAQVSGKPTAFPTTWDTVTGKPTTFASTWTSVANKPSTFPPASHNQPWSTITGVPEFVEIPTGAGARVAYAETGNLIISLVGTNNWTPTDYLNTLNGFLRASGTITVHPWQSGTGHDRTLSVYLEINRSGTSTWSGASYRLGFIKWQVGELSAPKSVSFSHFFQTPYNHLNRVRIRTVATGFEGNAELHSSYVELTNV